MLHNQQSFFSDGRDFVATAWLSRVRELLKAFEKITKEVPETSPILVSAPNILLLGHALEMILKVATKMNGASFKRTHNLWELWDQGSKEKLESRVDEVTNLYVNENRRWLGEYLEDILEEEPHIGEPHGTFEENLDLMNKWFDHPYQARYPRTGLMAGPQPDLKYLFFVANRLQKNLIAEAIEKVEQS